MDFSRVTVDATADLITSPERYEAGRSDDEAVVVLLKNVTGTATVYLYDSNAVTVGNGYPWVAADGPIELDIPVGEQLWGLSGGAAQDIAVIRRPRD